MSFPKTIQLHAAKDTTRRLNLEYRDAPVDLTQARLAGRRTLLPTINFDDYSCRAVIDWVSITFELARSTQFHHLQAALEPLAGRRPHVVASSPGPGGVAAVFTVIFQEPTLAILQASHELVKGKFGEVSEPFINELEVSVDFTPRKPSDDSRARMVAVLTRHLHPGRDVFNRESTRPRFSWGSRRTENSFTLRRSKIDLDDDSLFLNPAGDVAPPIDATYYIGHRKVGALWRVMDKVIDRQNRDAGTWIDLSEEDKRARVEIRLDRLELKRMGVTSLADLLRFNFAQLQGRYFKFMLPTFMVETPAMCPTDRHWERQRLSRFLNVGVVGLQALDEQRRDGRKKHRPMLVAQLRNKGIPAPAVDRSGRGVAGTLMSYKIMNRRVEVALRKLMEREKRKLD